MTDENERYGPTLTCQPYRTSYPCEWIDKKTKEEEQVEQKHEYKPGEKVRVKNGSHAGEILTLVSEYLYTTNGLWWVEENKRLWDSECDFELVERPISTTPGLLASCPNCGAMCNAVTEFLIWSAHPLGQLYAALPVACTCGANWDALENLEAKS